MVALIPYLNSAKAQNDNIYKVGLEKLEVYENSIEDYYGRKWKAERKEYEIVNEKKIWRYLPSVGITFGMPTINFNPYIISQAKQERAIFEAKLSSLDKRYNLDFEEQLQAVRNEYYKLRVTEEHLEREKAIIKMWIDFFNDFTSNEEHDKIITPKEFRLKIIENSTRSMEYERRKNLYYLAILDFQKLSKYQLPSDRLRE